MGNIGQNLLPLFEARYLTHQRPVKNDYCIDCIVLASDPCGGCAADIQLVKDFIGGWKGHVFPYLLQYKCHITGTQGHPIFLQMMECFTCDLTILHMHGSLDEAGITEENPSTSFPWS